MMPQLQHLRRPLHLVQSVEVLALQATQGFQVLRSGSQETHTLQESRSEVKIHTKPTVILAMRMLKHNGDLVFSEIGGWR